RHSLLAGRNVCGCVLRSGDCCSRGEPCQPPKRGEWQMTPTLLGYLGFVALIGLIAFGVPIAWAVTIVAFSGLSLLLGPHQAVVQFFATAYNTGSEFLFMAIPSFILMGQIVARS